MLPEMDGLAVCQRIRAVMRRLPAQKGRKTIIIDSLCIHLPSLSASLGGQKLTLTRKEVELLFTLASAPGRVFTRDNLLTLVWGYEHAGNYRAADSHIKRLRQMLLAVIDNTVKFTSAGKPGEDTVFTFAFPSAGA